MPDLPDFVPVYMSTELFKNATLRDWEGNPLEIEWGEPDAQGFYTPTFRTIFPISGPVEELEGAPEVFFATSNDRIFRAYLRWFNKASPRNSQNRTDALEHARALVRYLDVPSVDEIELLSERSNE